MAGRALAVIFLHLFNSLVIQAPPAAGQNVTEALSPVLERPPSVNAFWSKIYTELVMIFGTFFKWDELLFEYSARRTVTKKWLQPVYREII